MSSSEIPHEDDDKGGKLRRKRASQARSLVVLVALVGFILLVSVVKLNHKDKYKKYIPSRKLRRQQHHSAQAVEDNKALELEPAAGRQIAESFLPPDSIYQLSTKVSYEELSILQEKYASRGFSVLAFPISDFHQELPDNNSILGYVQEKYPQVNFPIFGLSSLAENPVYDKLQKTSGHKVQWNFYKFLLDRNGKVVGTYNHQENPLSLTGDIEKLLDESDPHSHKLVTH
ncbi:unnamed protein product [Cylindrotheca closterium]|uniref:Glutathione peroxidase n=1 Tax=Cylindrotheca closterium TaxID=2856 RepID=A0AAD2JPH0_9STRA|nr:unnamed protein product [Cylindrotheca closterium]